MPIQFLILFLGLTGSLHAASFIPIGDLTGGKSYSVATAVSDDGRVVVGTGTTVSGSEAFIWTAEGGFAGLGHLADDDESEARDVSADGRVVVGSSSRRGLFLQPFRWSVDSDMVGLGRSYWQFGNKAVGVDATGETIVGAAALGDGGYRWTIADGIVPLGSLGDTSTYTPTDVSADGRVIVGFGRNAEERVEAFRQVDGVRELLGAVPGNYESIATGVSPDSRVVVGFSSGDGLGSEAFRWTPDRGMVGLGYFAEGGSGGLALAASANGTVIVGRSGGVSGNDAFVWTESGGMERLLDVLVANGASGLSGWRLTWAADISADGRWVVGYGTNTLGETEAFLADLTPVPLPAVGWLVAFASAVLFHRAQQTRKCRPCNRSAEPARH